MKEQHILESMLDVADMQYHNTGDKWWLRTYMRIGKKLRKDRRK